MAKYDVVVCYGDSHDYTWELFDTVTRWKDARNYYNQGAIIYCNGKRIEFINHTAVAQAFHDLALEKHVGLCVVEDNVFVADIRLKSAYDTLEKYGLTADAIWHGKRDQRYDNAYCTDPLRKPFYKRNIRAVPLYSAETRKLVKVIDGLIGEDELPF